MNFFRRPDRPCSDCDGTGEPREYAARTEAQRVYSNQVPRCAGCDGTGSEKVRRWNERAKRWNERADRWERERQEKEALRSLPYEHPGSSHPTPPRGW